MAEQWRVIDLCSFEGELRAARGAVEVCPEDGAPTTVPVAEVAVVLVGMKVTLSAAVLHRLAEADVAVLFCDWRGIPEGGCYSWSDHGRVAAPPPPPGGGLTPSQEERVGTAGAGEDRGASLGPREPEDSGRGRAARARGSGALG